MPSSAATPPAPVPPPLRPHWASRVEDSGREVIGAALRRRGWAPRVLPYAGYGTGGKVRVLARVLLGPSDAGDVDLDGARGWRRFLTASAGGVPVQVEIAGRRHTVVSGRGGYVDAVLDVDVAPGPRTATFTVGETAARGALFVVPADARLGLVSDIDDTVMITALPRPMLAFWNTFVRHESARRPVPGMASFYQEVRRRTPDAFVVYLSTGPWNVAPALTAFLDRNGYPPGPLLMTDWGTTSSGWFRSGPDHKRTQLRRLLAELPQLTWLLVGDDGQHDPQLYREAADAARPGQVLAIAIRRLTVGQQVLAHGTPVPLPDADADDHADDHEGSDAGTAQPPIGTPLVQADDGHALLEALDRSGLLGEGWPR